MVGSGHPKGTMSFTGSVLPQLVQDWDFLCWLQLQLVGISPLLRGRLEVTYSVCGMCIMVAEMLDVESGKASLTITSASCLVV